MSLKMLTETVPIFRRGVPNNFQLLNVKSIDTRYAFIRYKFPRKLVQLINFFFLVLLPKLFHPLLPSPHTSGVSGVDTRLREPELHAPRSWTYSL